MARTQTFSQASLTALLPKGLVSPKALKRAALFLLEFSDLPGDSPARMQNELVHAIEKTVKILTAKGRIEPKDRDACFSAWRRDFKREAPISGEFLRAIVRAFPEGALLKDAERWLSEFSVFGTGDETIDDVYKAVCAIRELQTVRDHRPLRTKVMKNLVGSDREQEAIGALIDRLRMTSLLTEAKIYALLKSKTRPLYDFSNLTMRDPSHGGCREEVEAYEKALAKKKRAEENQAEREAIELRNAERKARKKAGTVSQNAEEIPPRGAETTENRDEVRRPWDIPFPAVPDADKTEDSPSEPIVVRSEKEAQDVPTINETVPVGAEAKTIDTVFSDQAAEAQEKYPDVPAKSAGAFVSSEKPEKPANIPANNARTFLSLEKPDDLSAGEKTAEEKPAVSEDISEKSPDKAEESPSQIPAADRDGNAQCRTTGGEITSQNGTTGTGVGEKLTAEDEENPNGVKIVKVQYREGWNLTVSKEVNANEEVKVQDEASVKEAEKTQAERDEAELMLSVTAKRVFVTELDDAHALTVPEILSIPRLSLDGVIAFALKKADAMAPEEKTAYFERIRTENEELHERLVEADAGRNRR